jgi:uncharacterized membrane protein
MAGLKFKLGGLVRAIFGVLFLVLGNFAGQLRPNSFVGIRLPLTMEDAEVWRLAHRRGGWIFMGIGLCGVITAALPDLWGYLTLLLALIVGIIYICVYSYRVYRERHSAPA